MCVCAYICMHMYHICLATLSLSSKNRLIHNKETWELIYGGYHSGKLHDSHLEENCKLFL